MAEKSYQGDVVNGHEVDTEAVEDPNGAGAPEFAESKDLRCAHFFFKFLCDFCHTLISFPGRG